MDSESANKKRRKRSQKSANSNKKKKMAVKVEVIEIDDSSPSPVGKGSPLRHIFCLNNREDLEKYEEEDCIILGFDPYNNSDVLRLTNGENQEADLCVIAEKGQVACRDYPHPRNTCAEFPFEKTSHNKHCKLCYCYVCDLPAPCKKWTGTTGHCHAFNNEAWNEERRVRRKSTKTV